MMLVMRMTLSGQLQRPRLHPCHECFQLSNIAAAVLRDYFIVTSPTTTIRIGASLLSFLFRHNRNTTVIFSVVLLLIHVFLLLLLLLKRC